MLLSENEIKTLAQRVVESLLPDLDEGLRNMARASGWPEKIVDSLSVQFNGYNLVVDYPDAYAQEVDDLEYGKPFGLPNTVIRAFITRAKPMIAETFSQVVVDEMVGSLM